MRTATLFRLGALLALIQYGVHAFLFISAGPTHGASEVAVINAMKEPILGLDRSYWDFYFGYGLLAILSGLIEVILLWQLGALAQTAPRKTIPVAVLFVAANVVHALLIWHYFRLIPPITFDVLVAICLSVAVITARRTVA